MYTLRGETTRAGLPTVGAVDEHGGDDRHVVLRLDRLPVLVLVRQQLRSTTIQKIVCRWLENVC